jgi:DNA repair protein RadC
VHPREVFAPAIEKRAAAVIAAHNHPSGDLTPSAEDLAATRRLAHCGRVLGIALLDHVIIGEQGYLSMRQSGRL